jgi:hypothetical protein
MARCPPHRRALPLPSGRPIARAGQAGAPRVTWCTLTLLVMVKSFGLKKTMLSTIPRLTGWPDYGPRGKVYFFILTLLENFFYTWTSGETIYLFGPRQGRQRHWCPFSTRGSSLAMMDCRAPIRLHLLLLPPSLILLFFNAKLSHKIWPLFRSHPLTPLYRGLVPRVPWVTSYNKKIWIRLVPSSGKRLGNQAPCTRDGRTTPG